MLPMSLWQVFKRARTNWQWTLLMESSQITSSGRLDVDAQVVASKHVQVCCSAPWGASCELKVPLFVQAPR
jgi:hypothetical protein